MKTNGIERLVKDLRAQFITNYGKYNNSFPSFEESQNIQDCLDQSSIGQLYTLAVLDERTKGLKLHNIDKEGTLYLTITGLYGGMDLDGYIHT